MIKAPVSKPGCCPGVPASNRMQTIINISRHLSGAHVAVARTYEGLADEMKDPKDAETFREAAKRHYAMAEETSKPVVLEEFVPEEPVAQMPHEVPK